MRIGSTILLLDGYCYQSYQWNKLRPLGKLQSVVDSLEEYECDEISIIRPIRKQDSTESYLKDLDIIKSLKCLTPISFGGGLRDKKQLDLLHKLPIERLIFSSAFIKKDLKLLKYAKDLFGNQAIQALLPFKIENNILYIFSSYTNNYIKYTNEDFNFINNYANEIILYDTTNEGTTNSYNKSIFDYITISKTKLILSGGVQKNDIKIAKHLNIASILIENKVLHKEYSIKDYKNA